MQATETDTKSILIYIWKRQSQRHYIACYNLYDVPKEENVKG